MTQAEIITIGTELLLGEIQDTNTRYLALQLRQLGIDLFRVTIIGDNPLRIADMIRESLTRADVVITTGGLGPTIDDPTRNAAAIAYNVEMIFHAELWKEIYRRFQSRGIIPSDNNQKQAFLPSNAIAIHNPVGTAPAFFIAENDKVLVCLPGVPAEMETIFKVSVIPLLRKQFSLHQLIKTRVIHTSGIGESVVDDLISDLETQNNPTVGLSAHPGSVDIRVTAKASSPEEADRMIAEVEQLVLERLPLHVYGFDDDTLMEKIIHIAREKKLSLELFTHGLPQEMFMSIDQGAEKCLRINRLDAPFSLEADLKPPAGAAWFALNFSRKEELSTLEMFLVSPEKQEIRKRQFNGAAPQLVKWIENSCLDFIWHKLVEIS